MGDKELRDAVRHVVNGKAKISEVYYGDDGIDMAEDIACVLKERDRYKKALKLIAKGIHGREQDGDRSGTCDWQIAQVTLKESP